jgi:hypothetical protein
LDAIRSRNRRISVSLNASNDIPESDIEIREHAVDGHAVVKAVVILNKMSAGISPVLGFI